MKKSPAFQFYPKDFITDDKVAIMNLEDVGAYILLLSYCWENCGLPTDPDELKEMCGNPENWQKIWLKVGRCFYEREGRLHNRRLDEEREKQREWREKSSKGGKRGAKTRWGNKGKNKGGYKMVITKALPKGNSPSSSSSSSSIKNKKEIYKEKVIEILKYFNEKTGKNFRSDPQNFISGRLNDGFTVEDCKRVIDIKTTQWLHDPENNKWLRPETLFRPTKFESYLNEKLPGETLKAPSGRLKAQIEGE